MDYGALSLAATDFHKILVACYAVVKENELNMHESNLKRVLVAKLWKKITEGETEMYFVISPNTK